jgi:TPR repeat protein
MKHKLTFLFFFSAFLGFAQNERKDFSAAKSLYKEGLMEDCADILYRYHDKKVTDPETAFLLSRCYQHGYGKFDSDLKRSKNFYEKSKSAIWESSQREDTLAMHFRGLMYSDAFFEIKNIDSSYHWFLKAAEKGNTISMYNLGTDLIQKKDSLEGFKWLQKAAFLGNPKSASYLGDLYFYAKNSAAALEKYMEAAEKGDRNAMENLAKMMKGGTLSEEEFSEADGVFRNLVEKGSLSAAKYYITVHQPDLETDAYTHRSLISSYRLAAENGDVEAMYKLARTYNHFKEYSKALRWFDIAASYHHPDAKYFLYVYYNKGISTPVNLRFAIFYLNEAYESGSKLAKEVMDGKSSKF